jgi:hypothetical protein
VPSLDWLSNPAPTMDGAGAGLLTVRGGLNQPRKPDQSPAGSIPPKSPFRSASSLRQVNSPKMSRRCPRCRRTCQRSLQAGRLRRAAHLRSQGVPVHDVTAWPRASGGDQPPSAKRWELEQTTSRAEALTSSPRKALRMTFQGLKPVTGPVRRLSHPHEPRRMEGLRQRHQ